MTGLVRKIGLFAALMTAGAASAIAPGYDQLYRPQYHFSPRENWTNDPNGLVYFEGEYHLFFQYNPFGDEWGHMSWGHAVSPDLMHWRQLPVALPEQDGIMIFTGSTVVDEHNSSGFCTGNKACMVAVYTGHTPPSGTRPALQTQNIAYSNDRGRTWTKYPGNPVLNLNLTDFRDPKVFWSQKSNRWVMVVSLPNDHKVRLYGSPDLKKWAALSEFGPAGATGGQWECPELFELPVEGAGRETRWILKVGLNPGGLGGGSGEQYFVGRFDGTRFTNDNPASQTLWTDYGKDCYCALTFNHLPAAHAPVMLGWMNDWQYAAKLPTSPWRGQMTIPRKLSLRQTGAGIRMYQQPADELQGLKGESIAIRGSTKTYSHSFELQAEMKPGGAQQVGWKLLAADGTYTVVGYKRASGTVFVDRRHSGRTDFSKDFPAISEAPLQLPDGVLRLRVLVDRCSVEVFAGDGEVAITDLVFPPAGASQIDLWTAGGNAGEVKATYSEIRSVWSQ
ncbi:MAG: glycoside hydrolase family 32 protein [Acidobacteriaceae bacterium]|nr:glycoside hydrolase family 32 protein [Acidobacteriaceae bacterium]